MIKWFKSIFAWRDVKEVGVYIYQENLVTGKRRVLRINQSGYTPIDRDWLDGIEPRELVPPTGGSALGK